MAAVEPTVERTYGNWRKPTSPGAAGLGAAGTLVLLVGLVLSVLTMMANVVAGFSMLALAGLSVAPLAIRDHHGRTLGQRLLAFAAWHIGRSRGQHLYRGGPTGVGGTFRMPGLAANSTISEARDSYNRPFALICYPAIGHYAVLLECGADGASLVDIDQVDTWVAHWGQFLSTLGHEPMLVGASVTIETAPDPGTRLAREVGAHLDQEAPRLAEQVLTQVVETYPAGSAQVLTRVALTFTAARPGGRRRSAAEMATEIGARLPGLSSQLAMTGAGEARPMTAVEVAEMARVAYDPSVQALVEQARAAGGTHLTWADAGPSSAEEYRGHYLHDGAASITWIMSGAPRGEVLSGVLAHLVGPHRDIDRKRVTLLYRPHGVGEAARLVERDRRDAAFVISGPQTKSRHLVAQAAAEQTAREEARGAGVVRFAMLVTATVRRPADLPLAEAAIDVLAPSARVQLRRAHGSQAAAFLGALGIGVVLPDHVRVPAMIRDAL